MNNFNNHHAMLTEYCEKHDLPLPLVVEPEDGESYYTLGENWTYAYLKDIYECKKAFQSGIWPAEHAQVLQDHFYGVRG